jgi:hypothetical protein
MDFQLAITGHGPLTRQIYDQIRSAFSMAVSPRGNAFPQLANLQISSM